MKCQHCDHEFLKYDQYCRNCGSKLSLLCPECRFEVFPDDKFCGKCGYRLADIEKETRIDNSQFLPVTQPLVQGERKTVTILVAYADRYTALYDKLDPENVRRIMDGCFKILIEEIHICEGAVTLFTGDGVMALFGAPAPLENHAQMACHAALSIQKALSVYSGDIQKDFGIPFHMRIGLDSGPAVILTIGDNQKTDFTAMGDTVNLASRMGELAGPGAIWVSGNTYNRARGFFEFAHIQKTQIRGKDLDIYELKEAREGVAPCIAPQAHRMTRFVGRRNSMAALMDIYEQARSGAGQVVGVTGEAGVGKSRLVLEMMNRLPENEFTRLEGKCLQYGGSVLYKPVLDILKSLFEIKEQDREDMIQEKIRSHIGRDLEHALPAFQDLLCVTVEDEAFLKLDPKQKRDKIFAAIRNLLIRESQKKPLILVVEDVHWIDGASQDFFDDVIPWIEKASILLVLLYRPEYPHDLFSSPCGHRIVLTHLREESAGELVKALLTEELPVELRDLLLVHTGGNPLFMEELTRALIDNGSLRKQDNRYVLSRNLTDIDVPKTIQEIIAARMDALGENQKRTLQAASVIGREFTLSVLQTITGMHQELHSYLMSLQDLDFIHEKKGFPEAVYIFKHALTQEAGYNSQLLNRRKQVHETIARTIEDLNSDKLEEHYETLAYHYSKSEKLEKAVHYFKLSGIKAAENYANREALNFYKEALKLLERLPDTEENKKAQIEVGKSLRLPMWRLGYPDGSLEILQNLEKLSKEIEDKNSFTAFCTFIGSYYTFKGYTEEAKRHVEPYFYEAQKAEDIDSMAPLAMILGESYQQTGLHYKVIDFLPGVIALIEKNNRLYDRFNTPLNIYSHLCQTLSWSLSLTGQFEEAKMYLEKGEIPGIKTNDKFSIGHNLQRDSLLSEIKSDGKKVIEHSENCLKYFEEIDDLFHMAISLWLLGCGYYFLGDLAIAKKHVEEGYAMQKGISVNWVISYYPYSLCLIRLDEGDIVTAQNYAKEALELSIKEKTLSDEGRSRCMLGRVKGKRKSSEFDEGERLIIQGIKILEELKLRPWISRGYYYLGELYSDIGEYDKALNWLEKAKMEFQNMGMEYDLSFAKSLLGKTLFKINPSRFSESEQTILDAIKIAQNIDSRPALAMGYLCLGELYTGSGLKENALENLKRAETMYQEMGMGLWLGKTKEALDLLLNVKLSPQSV
jgi:class 3 adenylate cyclase/tetratricopeptide (TPR) repeat protein